MQKVAAPETTYLSLSATLARVDYGGSTTLSGELSTGAGPIAGATLELTSSADGTSWSGPVAVATDAAGRFAAQVTPDEDHSRTLYRVTFAGTDTLAPADAQVAVDSRPDLTAPLVPLNVGRTSGFAASGTLRPRQTPGQALISLACYRREGGLWVLRQTTHATVTDNTDDSGYAATLSMPTAGRWRLRAVFAQGTAAETWSPWSRDVTVGAARDAPIWDRDGVSTIPERMVSRLDARQLIVTTGRSLGSRDGTLRLFDYRDGDWVRTLTVRTRLGARGLIDGLLRRAGSLTTPTGIWRLPSFAFGTHENAPAGVRTAYRHITRHSWWSSERNATYNTWVETTRAVYGEHLADYPVEYEFALSTGYNALPNACVYGRGAGIFVHVFGRAYTAGCVSVSRADMIFLLRWLDPAKRAACAIGTTRSGTRSCISAY
ncbi:MAG TPA: L,D-transpeptidase family protein [Thermoleophilia bacterium]